MGAPAFRIPLCCCLLSAALLAVPRAVAQEDLLKELAASSAEPQAFQVQASLLYPEQASGHPTVLRVAFACQPNYYVQADSIRVELAVGAPAGVTVGRLSMPAPKQKHDEYLKQQVRYFDGEFAISALLDIGSGVQPGRHEVPLEVSYTGCGPNLCQFRKDRVTVSLTVTQGAPPVAVTLPAEAQPPAGPPVQAPAAAPMPFGENAVIAVLIAFVWGLGLTLTPCIYPLIPVTLTIVGATAGARRLDGLVRSLVYVLGISVSYAALGTLAAATGRMFGTWLQHPVVYLALAAVFVLMAGGMFDLYSVAIASQRLQRLQARLRGRGGLAGIWAIGLLSGVAATACIAPIVVGVLTYVAERGSLLLGFLMFFALAWGMGTPLVLLGTFTGVAKSLPRAGPWMVTVKHLFGFALLAVAVFFVGKSRVLPPFLFSMLLGAFLLTAGVFAGASDVVPSKAGAWARLRKAAGLLLLAGAVMAFAQPFVAGGPAAGEAAQIAWVDSEQEAVARAKAEQKPVLLDFWADYCAPCHKMFRTTFVDPAVVAESRRFVCGKVDVSGLTREESNRLRTAYGVLGVPTVVLIGSDGRRVSRVGEIGPEQMLELMRPMW